MIQGCDHKSIHQHEKIHYEWTKFEKKQGRNKKEMHLRRKKGEMKKKKEESFRISSTYEWINLLIYKFDLLRSKN